MHHQDLQLINLEAKYCKLHQCSDVLAVCMYKGIRSVEPSATWIKVFDQTSLP